MAGKPRDFVKLVAEYYQDDRIMRAGERAEILYVRTLSWCAKSLSDGVVTRRQVGWIARGMRETPARIRRLCDLGLWEELPDDRGYKVTGWLKHNRTSSEILAGRAQDVQRKEGARRPHVQQRVRPDMAPKDSHVRPLEKEREEEKSETRPPSGSGRVSLPAAAQRGTGGAAQHPDIAAVRLELQRTAAQRRAKLNKPPTVNKGRDEHVDFSATLAKLTEAAERLNPSNSEVEQ